MTTPSSLPNPAGFRRTPTAIVSIIAALTSTTLYQLTPGATCKVRKVMWANRNAASGYLRIGETVAAVFTQRLPQIYMAAGLGDTEIDIPEFEFTSDVVAQSTVAAAAPTDIQVLPEVEELEGDAT